MVLYSSGLSIPLVLLACFAFWTIRTKIRGRRYRLPPTVPGHVIYGNMLQVPHPAGMWLKGLAEQYGEMYWNPTSMKGWLANRYYQVHPQAWQQDMDLSQLLSSCV